MATVEVHNDGALGTATTRQLPLVNHGCAKVVGLFFLWLCVLSWRYESQYPYILFAMYILHGYKGQINESIIKKSVVQFHGSFPQIKFKNLWKSVDGPEHKLRLPLAPKKKKKHTLMAEILLCRHWREYTGFAMWHEAFEIVDSSCQGM